VPLSVAERVCYAVGLAGGLVAFFGTRSFLGPKLTWIAAGLAVLAGFVAVILGLIAAWRGRRQPTRKAEPAPA
jgi:uncharacterized membrane protein